MLVITISSIFRTVLLSVLLVALPPNVLLPLVAVGMVYGGPEQSPTESLLAISHFKPLPHIALLLQAAPRGRFVQYRKAFPTNFTGPATVSWEGQQINLAPIRIPELNPQALFLQSLFVRHGSPTAWVVLAIVSSGGEATVPLITLILLLEEEGNDEGSIISLQWVFCGVIMCILGQQMDFGVSTLYPLCRHRDESIEQSLSLVHTRPSLPVSSDSITITNSGAKPDVTLEADTGIVLLLMLLSLVAVLTKGTVHAHYVVGLTV